MSNHGQKRSNRVKPRQERAKLCLASSRDDSRNTVYRCWDPSGTLVHFVSRPWIMRRARVRAKGSRPGLDDDRQCSGGPKISVWGAMGAEPGGTPLRSKRRVPEADGDQLGMSHQLPKSRSRSRVRAQILRVPDDPSHVFFGMLATLENMLTTWPILVKLGRSGQIRSRS